MTDIGNIYEFGLKKIPGEEGKRSEILLDFVRRKNIDIVIDVRRGLGNKWKNWDCSGDNLAKFLYKNGVDYYQFRALGTPLKYNRLYRRDYEEFKKVYYNEILMKNMPTINKIINFLRKGKNVVLLCVERNEKCHRFII